MTTQQFLLASASSLYPTSAKVAESYLNNSPMEHVEKFTFSHVEDLLRTTYACPAKMNVFSPEGDTKSSNFSETMYGNRVGAGNSIDKTFSKKEIIEMCRKDMNKFMIMSTEFATVSIGIDSNVL
ncbi:11633_t:CDS:2 [Funneliformis caledonium]|uniref:11633_t:CDS:1 n=1 Tax=Funneliformis caledonium TaxID=1117310 RepID=A0A9N9AWV4_9GLOM|nr:11633_t:CDS:2 [Funneliformis caledonium]